MCFCRKITVIFRGCLSLRQCFYNYKLKLISLNPEEQPTFVIDNDGKEVTEDPNRIDGETTAVPSFDGKFC